MKILYISANGFPSSDRDFRGNFSLEHAQALQDEGAQVQAVDLQSSEFSTDVVDDLSIMRIPDLFFLIKRLRFRQIAKHISQIWQLRFNTHYDVIIFSFMYAKYVPYAAFFRKKKSCTLLIVHGGDAMRESWLKNFLRRWLFRLVDIATPVSFFTETLLSCLISRKNRDNEKICTIYNGVDIEKLKPVLHDRNEMRKKLGYSDKDFVIISICTLIKRKGLHLLIQAVSECLQSGQNLHHIIIGKGPELSELNTLIEQSGYEDHFTILPSVESAELSSYLGMADLYSMISTTDWNEARTEGFGITYAEAMALGVPTIGGAGCGASSIIKEGFNGLLVSPHSPEIISDIVDAISRFQSDKAFYNRCADNCETYIKENISWEKNAKKTLQLIHDWQDRSCA